MPARSGGGQLFRQVITERIHPEERHALTFLPRDADELIVYIIGACASRYRPPLLDHRVLEHPDDATSELAVRLSGSGDHSRERTRLRHQVLRDLLHESVGCVQSMPVTNLKVQP